MSEGAVQLGVGIDLTAALAKIDILEARLTSIGDLPITVNGINTSKAVKDLDDLLKNLQTTANAKKIIPGVSLAPLEGLSKELSYLQAHLINTQRLFKNRTIVPSVDLRPLQELNKELDKKQRHWNQTRSLFTQAGPQQRDTSPPQRRITSRDVERPQLVGSSPRPMLPGRADQRRLPGRAEQARLEGRAEARQISGVPQRRFLPPQPTLRETLALPPVTNTAAGRSRDPWLDAARESRSRPRYPWLAGQSSPTRQRLLGGSSEPEVMPTQVMPRSSSTTTGAAPKIADLFRENMRRIAQSDARIYREVGALLNDIKTAAGSASSGAGIGIKEARQILEGSGYRVGVNSSSTSSSRRGANAGRGYNVYEPGATEPKVMSLRQVRGLAAEKMEASSSLAKRPAQAAVAATGPISTSIADSMRALTTRMVESDKRLFGTIGELLDTTKRAIGEGSGTVSQSAKPAAKSKKAIAAGKEKTWTITPTANQLEEMDDGFELDNSALTSTKGFKKHGITPSRKMKLNASQLAFFAGEMNQQYGSFGQSEDRLKAENPQRLRSMQGLNGKVQSMLAESKGIGKDATAGLNQGVKSGLIDVSETAKEVSDSLVNALKNNLEIRSPSRVMMRLGEMTGEGFLIGLRDKLGALKGMVKQAVQGLDAKISGDSSFDRTENRKLSTRQGWEDEHRRNEYLSNEAWHYQGVQGPKLPPMQGPPLPPDQTPRPPEWYWENDGKPPAQRTAQQPLVVGGGTGSGGSGGTGSGGGPRPTGSASPMGRLDRSFNMWLDSILDFRQGFERQATKMREGAKSVNDAKRDLQSHRGRGPASESNDDKIAFEEESARLEAEITQRKRAVNKRVKDSTYQGVSRSAVAAASKGGEFLGRGGDLNSTLGLIEQIRKEGTGLQSLFKNLGTTSFIDVNKGLNEMEVSLQEIRQAAAAGLIPQSDLRAAEYNFRRETTGAGMMDARNQTRAGAFDDLGIESYASQRATRRQRNESLKFLEEDPTLNPKEKERARNARKVQQLGYEDELVRGVQEASGFGGFRGREIGNESLKRMQQEAQLTERLIGLERQRDAIRRQVGDDPAGNERVNALTREINNGRIAQGVLNNTATSVEKLGMTARNAFGVFSDDLGNLIPQLIAFGFAYNVIFSQILPLPGVIVGLAGNFDRLSRSITSYIASTRGIADSSGVMRELVQQSMDLGVNTDVLGKSYLNFAATSLGTPLEGRETDMTRTLATAGRNRGLTGEEIGNASKALNQMLSKGTVQSEELRGQLAEAIPGAVQIAARAMGITTKELYKMVEAGNVASDVFVDKFMSQLIAEGDGVNRAAGSFASVTEQLGASSQVLGASMGKTLLEPITLIAQLVNTAVKALVPLGPLLTVTFLVAGVGALKSYLKISESTITVLMNLGRAGFAAAAGIQASNNSMHTAPWVPMQKGAAGAAGGVAMLGMALKNLMGFAAKVALFAAAFEVLAGAIKTAKGEMGSLSGVRNTLNSIGAKSGGGSNKLNPLQQVAGRLNLAKNYEAAADFGSLLDIRKKTWENINQMKAARTDYRAFMKKDLELEKQENRARADLLLASAEGTLEQQLKVRNQVKGLSDKRRSNRDALPFDPSEIVAMRTQIDAGIGGAKAQFNRGKSLGMRDDSSDQRLWTDSIKKLEKAKADLNAFVKSEGLEAAVKVAEFNAGTMEAEARALQEVASKRVLFSGERDGLNARVAAKSGIVADANLSPETRKLNLLQLQTRAAQELAKVQETAGNIRLKMLADERSLIEAQLGLAQTRQDLAQARLESRKGVAEAIGLPGEAANQEMALIKAKRDGRSAELTGQAKLLDNDRQRSEIEAKIQKIALNGQTAQLKVSQAQLVVEQATINAKLAEMSARKIPGDNPQVKAYQAAKTAIDAALGAVGQQIQQQGELSGLIDQQVGTATRINEIRKQGLEVERAINAETSASAVDLQVIEGMKRDISEREKVAEGRVGVERERLANTVSGLEEQLSVQERIYESQKKIIEAREQDLQGQQEVVDKQLELIEASRKGGFNERMVASNAMGGDTSEERMIAIARERHALMNQIADEQAKQRDLEAKAESARMEFAKAMFVLKQQEAMLAITSSEIQLAAQRELLTNQLRLQQARGTISEGGKEVLAQLNARNAQNGFVAGGKPGATDETLVNAGRLNLAQDANLQNQKVQLGETGRAGLVAFEGTVKAQGDYIDGIGREAGIKREIAGIDADLWLAKLLDSGTSFGRVMSTVSSGLERLGDGIAGSFIDGIRNGGMSEKISDAAGKFADDIITSMVKEYVVKPMQDRVWEGMKMLFGGEKPTTPEEQISSNTRSAADGIARSNDLLGGVISAIDRLGGLFTSQQPAYSPLVADSGTAIGSVINSGGMGFKGGGITGWTPDKDREQSGYDITLPGGAGTAVPNPTDSLRITGTGFQGKGSGAGGVGYGNWVAGEFTGKDGKLYEVLLGHFDKVFVKVGDTLAKGAAIGLQGNSGHSTGAHVTSHVNAKNGGDAWKTLKNEVMTPWIKGWTAPKETAPVRQENSGSAMAELLRRIRSGEGSYASINRGVAGDTPGGKPGLTSMTVGQVMDMQQAGKAFAVGAYQFIPKTLAGAVERSGISRGEKFSPAIQDKLASELILGGAKRPGLSAYLTGKGGSLNGANDEIAGEWAALRGSNGRGKYDGDKAGNQASLSVMDLLPRVRQEVMGGGGVSTAFNNISPGPSALQVKEGNQLLGMLSKGPLPVTVTNLPVSTDGLVPSDPIGVDGLPSDSPAAESYGGSFDTSQNFAGIEQKVSKWETDLDGTISQTVNTNGLLAGINGDLQLAQGSTANLAGGFGKMGDAIGGVVGILGSVAAGLAGIGQMKKGGTYNTLMGLAGIFGAIGGIAGSFGKGGGLSGLFRAEGGPINAREPYIVGERGMEVIFPQSSGTAASASKTRSLLQGGSRSMLEEQRANMEASFSRSIASEVPQPLDIRFQSEVINQTEYVTARQHRQGMREAALTGQAMSYRGLRESNVVRRRTGQ